MASATFVNSRRLKPAAQVVVKLNETQYQDYFMRPWCWHRLFRRVPRFVRRLVACAVVPMLLVGSSATQAVLIHDHDGHEPHGHMLTSHDLDEWRSGSAHRHEEHEPHDRPSDSTEDEDRSLVIVLNLPVALPRAQGSSNRVAATDLAPTTTILAIEATVPSVCRPRSESQVACAHLWTAHSWVARILLTSHALLL